MSKQIQTNDLETMDYLLKEITRGVTAAREHANNKNATGFFSDNADRGIKPQAIKRNIISLRQMLMTLSEEMNGTNCYRGPYL